MHIEKLHLPKLNNTRDLGGFPTEDGKRIAAGKLIRSGRLYKLPARTVCAIKKMGVTDIIDLRTDRERYEYPCTQIDGVNYILLPLVCTATPGITHSKSMARVMLEESKRIKSEFGTADNYMTSVYELILFDEDSRKRLKQFFGVLLKAKGGVIWHCNAGKDRTGLCAMLVESVLGVSEDLIVKDYCKSKSFQSKMRFSQKIALYIAPFPMRFKQILFAFMEAKPQYIKGAIAEIKARYGSVTDYVKQALGLTDEDILALKEKYTE